MSTSTVGSHARGAQTDTARPFFAHLDLQRRRTLVLVPGLLAAMLVLQFLPAAVVLPVLSAVTGEQDPVRLVGHPVMLLAANLALGLLVPLTLVAVHVVGRVPWRAVLATGRSFSWRRLAVTVMALAPVFVVAVLTTALTVPGGYGEVRFDTPAVTLLVVTVLTMPLAAAAEEVLFRGVVGPAVGAWFRTPATAVVAGLAVSSVLFGAIHFATDPWMIGYTVWIGLAMGLLAVVTRGLETPIAFHVANNVVLFGLATLTSGGAGVVVDRSAGAGGDSMALVLTLVPFHLLVLGAVWLLERRRRAASIRGGRW
ncbi:CPBP family intramembrane glutamic endopeptidase [Pseudonocardia sp. HH130630-07]|uniref:CPBP family intramembrane glutamic endopeptidase n=1 Tax=Pseudonocardia sp. HH130630-07 TaxID=1690815 RepID=UPI0008152F5F|nr:CPBP family intramembrane glutamic endopeptidase [Pseudonocardia sp. HH130630-07]ANY07236.1 hypothetical protein AFB00_14160 [Pseudonocardia sp. HH130630-07]